eukprot:5203553-Prymnesium_polylepis.1
MRHPVTRWVKKRLSAAPRWVGAFGRPSSAFSAKRRQRTIAFAAALTSRRSTSPASAQRPRL